jgi:hypothetical protein
VPPGKRSGSRVVGEHIGDAAAFTQLIDQAYVVAAAAAPTTTTANTVIVAVAVVTRE